MKTNACVQKKHSQMVSTCNRACLAWVRYDFKVTAIKRWLIYEVRNFYSFRISPVCLRAWSGRRLDCNWHRKSISVGYAWRVCWNRSHTWKQFALLQKWQQLSLKHCFTETNSLMTKHKGMQESTMTRGTGKYLHEAVGSVLPFLLKYLLIILRLNDQKVTASRFCCKLFIISNLISTHRK